MSASGIVPFAGGGVTEWRLPAGGSFVITDEIGTELFRVSASGDVVKVEGVTLDPSLQSVLNGVTASADELNITDGLTATAAELNATSDLSALAVAMTANADGLTTAIIAERGVIQYITVTSGNSAHLITLPAPTPGRIVILDVGANGFKLRSSAPASVAINGGTGASAASTVAASSTCVMVCVSATAWKGFFLDADSDVAKVAAAA